MYNSFLSSQSMDLSNSLQSLTEYFVPKYRLNIFLRFVKQSRKLISVEIKLTLNSGLLWNMIAYLFYAKYMEVLLFFLRSIKTQSIDKTKLFFVTMFRNLLHKKLVKTLTWSLIFPRSLGGSGGFGDPSDLGGPKVPGV